MRKLEINRLIRELDFVKSDYDYKSEIIQEEDVNFIDSVHNFLDNHPQLKQVFEEKQSQIKEKTQQSIQRQTTEEIIPEVIEAQIEESISPKIRNLYRSIVKSTHPDKMKDSSLTELYLEATNAYESGSLLPIIVICDKLRIPYEITEEETNLMKSEIEILKNRVSFLETTFTWQWYCHSDEKIREKVIMSYIRAQLIK